MNIPNIPTDNLYKFIALFGLALIVSSSYMLNRAPLDMYNAIAEIQSKDQINKLKLSTDSTAISEKTNRIEINYEITSLQREINSFDNLLYLYLGLFLAGAILSFFGFHFWYHKTQKLNDKILEIETNEFVKNHLAHVRKIQFDKEFEVYKEIWPCLIKLRNSTFGLRPIFEFRGISETKEEIKNRKWIDFNDAFKKTLDVFETNKPFYPEKIYVEIEKVINTSKRESVEYEFMPPSETNYYKNGEKNMTVIIEQIDKICLSIRDRIGILILDN